MNLHRLSPPCAAFTLVELLTVIAIIGVLAALAAAVTGRVRRSAAQAMEISAARHLVAAYHLASTDLKGAFLPGSAGGREATAEDGSVLSPSIITARWPHQIRPYLGDRFRDTLYVGDQRAYYERTVSEYANNQFMREYQLSIATSFGLNARFVGGDGSLLLDPPVTRMVQALQPADLIAFAASRARELAADAGHWTITAPAYWTSSGAPKEADSSYASDRAYGHLAPRNSDAVTVAWLDGSVRRVAGSDLRDMRLWSDAARRANDPDYIPPAAP